jgi:sulfide dehydrogenase [flavocytochrome c] flavoprotein chain
MTNLTRRRFSELAGTSLLSLAATPLFAPAVLGQTKPRLVVIGGGPGGGTVARYVNKEAAGAVEVTLLEPQRKFTTCFFSNLYVGGYRNFASITHSYDKVKKEGVKVLHEMATAIDRDKKEVAVGRRRIPYDRLVVAPGIEAGPADAAPGAEAQCAQGWRSDCDDRAAQSLSLPSRTL